MTIRSQILTALYRIHPFPLLGDVPPCDQEIVCSVSCIINFFGRIDLLDGILFSLSEQSLPSSGYEVILIEDRGGTEEARRSIEKFASILNIRYFPLAENHGMMGYSRNYGISKAKGKYILFLDDDTVILQNDFLSRLIHQFNETAAEGIIPFGSASYCLVKGRYDYHDPYFPSNRCTAYRRSTLHDLGGFVSDIIGQEDVEFVMRFLISGRRFCRSPQLRFLHPPLAYPKLSKASAVGASYYRLKNRYPLYIWLLAIANGSRHVLLCLLPIRKYREMGRFGLGFLRGVLYAMVGKDDLRYE